MADLYVKQNINTEKIEENVHVDADKMIFKIKKKGIKKINYLPISNDNLPRNLPNTKNIKNKKLKNKIKKDVKLSIISHKKILANKKFKPVEEGYIKFDYAKRVNTKKGVKVSRSELGSHETVEHEADSRNTDKIQARKKLSESENSGSYLNETKEERRYLTQKYIYSNADVGTKKKVFDLYLNMGPYNCSYSRNGKYLLITGVKGHISLIDTQNLKTLCEMEVDESIKCQTILHNHKLFAVGQKKYIYIYDNTGLEINCIKDILYTYKMEFLPYHFLLASIGEFGELSYQDISVGNIVTRKKTKRGPCSIMKQNKNNAIIYLGHKNGHVTLWSPNVDKSVCDIFCHYTPISSIGISDNYLITSSVDCTYKIWDMRKLQYVQSYRSHNIINNIDISDTSIVGFSMNSHFRTYKNFFTSNDLYVTHNMYGDQINSICFQPFEDICCVGLKHSIKTLLVPGSGLANIDTFVNNPYETKKQVRENEVRSLLDKLPPDTIKFQKEQIGKLNPYVRQSSAQDITIPNRTNRHKKKANNKFFSKTDRLNEDNGSENGNSDNSLTNANAKNEENRNNSKRAFVAGKKKSKKKKKKSNFLNSNVPKYLRKSLMDRRNETD